MRSKLQKFAEFANALLPHEVDYLLSVQRFEDPERVQILQQVARNCRLIRDFEPYDESRDKRKFSYLKTWIEERLQTLDVDREYEWLAALEVRVMTDAMRPDEEKELLHLFRTADATGFNFLKLYDLGRIYRHSLQVRMRYAEHKVVTHFLEKQRTEHEYARLVNDKLHQATEDIVAQYARGSAESMRWEGWLTATFYENSLDGYNRVLALIRLIFIASNYRRFDLLPDKFDFLERLFREGKFYSKRILLNFYSQRLLLFAKQQEFDRAEYFGYLSIRARNSDYLYYVNNLAAILLRNRKPAEALRVLRAAVQEAKGSQNFHNKIGHAAYITLAFNQLKQYRQAETHAQTFFKAYKKEVFDHRWHLFFTAWLEALLRQEHYAKALKMAQTYQLDERDSAYRKSPNYLPSIPWSLAIAAYKTEKMSGKALTARFLQDLETVAGLPDQTLPAAMTDLVELAAACVPDRLAEVNSRLQKKGILLRVG